MKQILLLLAISLILWTGCKQDELPGDILSPIPQISLIDISPTSVQALDDEIRFEVQYQDGDGDLGSSDDAKNLFIQDVRIDNPHAFHLQQLAPDEANVPIQGTFVVTLPFTILTDNAAEQNVSFEIYVVDRAGNQSNILTTPEIVVTE
ncbi:MAG: hypothetical protein AAFQ83_20880 [Bacteroidota bacterium]